MYEFWDAVLKEFAVAVGLPAAALASEKAPRTAVERVQLLTRRFQHYWLDASGQADLKYPQLERNGYKVFFHQSERYTSPGETS